MKPLMKLILLMMIVNNHVLDYGFVIIVARQDHLVQDNDATALQVCQVVKIQYAASSEKVEHYMQTCVGW